MSDYKKALLDAHHPWPCPYSFKFIVPAKSVAEFESRLLGEERAALELRHSETKLYTAYTFTITMNSSDAVLAVYARMEGIAGLLAL